MIKTPECLRGGVMSLVLDWRDQSELAVEAAVVVVVPVDVLRNSDFEVVDPDPRTRLRTSSALNNELNASAMALS
jgi:hypothetical protein